MPSAALRSVTSLMLAAALLFAVVAPAAGAATDPDDVQLGITPLDHEGSFFELTLAPGEQVDLAVELANHGPSAVQARSYAADVYSLINGGMGVRLHDEPADNPATGWIDYPEATPTLQPDSAVRRTFTVTVPADAAPGDYIAALVLQHEGARADDTSDLGINQVVRQAIAVSISVPGPATPGLAIGETTHLSPGQHSTIRTELDNTGNRHLGPAGTVEITGPDGEVVMSRDVELAIVYADTSTHVETTLDHRLDPGTYTVTTTMADDTHDVTATHTSTFDVADDPSQSSAVPGVDRVVEALDATGHGTLIVALLGVTILLLLVLLLVLARRRRPRPSAASPSQAVTPAPDEDPEQAARPSIDPGFFTAQREPRRRRSR